MRQRTLSFVGLALYAVVAAAPTRAQTRPATFRIHAPEVPSTTVAAIGSDLEWTEERIAGMLGAFPDSVSVQVVPDRKAFSAALREAWGIPETACWMVGAADDHRLYLLSPAVWSKEACEHDPGNEQHRRMLISHEAVHAFHGQLNPTDDLGLLEDLGWFIKGVATFVSGQLGAFHATRAREAIEAGAVPERLSQAWSGQYRYGVSGSMAAFIDARWGRQTLRQALAETSQASLLALLGTSESEFLRLWQEWVAATSGAEVLRRFTVTFDYSRWRRFLQQPSSSLTDGFPLVPADVVGTGQDRSRAVKGHAGEGLV